MRALSMAFALLLSAAAFCDEGKRIDSALHSVDYNRITSTYLDRPAWASVIDVSGDPALYITYDPYRKDPKRLAPYSITLTKSHADEYLQAIQKYKEWSEQATKAGDAFTKDIGKYKSFGSAKAEFGFHSGNSSHHLLYVGMCALFVCQGNGTYFDAQGVAEIERLLGLLKNGALVPEDVSKKYN